MEIYWIVDGVLLKDEEIKRRGKVFKAQLDEREKLKRALLVAFELLEESER